MKNRGKTLFSILFIIFAAPAFALAGSATLHWQPNTESDLAGYRIYYGTSSRSYGPYISVGKNTTSYTINKLTDGQTYYFALTAVDTSGNESGFSQEVSKTLAEKVASGGGSPGRPTSGNTAEVLQGDQTPASPPPVENKQAPVLNVRVNGIKGGLIGTPETTLSITVSLEKGDFGGQDADWWLYAETSFGRFSYVYGYGWTPGDHVTGKGKIENVNHFNALKGKLPVGTYKFVFALDNNNDGIRDETWRDFVDVKIVR